MNIRLTALSFGISLLGMGATALPAFADMPNTSNYGAGFYAAPDVRIENNTTPVISTGNYGAGFIGSPDLIGGNFTGTVYTANYGAGFFGSPNLRGGNYTGTVYTGNYGAGFFVSPAPWYGYNWFF